MTLTRDMEEEMVEMRLSPSAEAPVAARRSLERVTGGLDSHAVETLRLLVSELVTNSVRHAGLDSSQWIDLRVEPTPEAVRVSVSDPGRGFDRPSSPRAGDASGWGLYLVEQMADRWGVSQDGVTSVWFEIDRV